MVPDFSKKVGNYELACCCFHNASKTANCLKTAKLATCSQTAS